MVLSDNAQLFLRKVTADDMEVILQWRNDIESRRNSFNDKTISLSEHRNWFLRKQADPGCYMYILMDREVRAGSIRVDLEDNIGEISFVIAPSMRGRGYGKAIIRLLEDTLPQGPAVLIGMVKDFNVASQKCFLSNGFSSFACGEASVFVKLLMQP